MSNHSFVYRPGQWLGEGKITFSESTDQLRFFTRWRFVEGRDEVEGIQEIEVEGVPEKMENMFLFGDLIEGGFGIRLDNQLLGTVFGRGLTDENVIAWEFRADNEQAVEGFEVYELQADGTYSMRAEYVSSDQFRTIIEGKIWHHTA
jgi:hypothetical protein